MGDMSDPIVVMGICGSYDLDSANGRMLEIILEEARALGAETVIWDHGAKPLPLVGAKGSWDDANVKGFQEMAVSADAFVLSSPEYHGTMSGVMKNSLDWLYSKHTSGKVFGLICTLGGQSSNNTLNHMRIAARWIHGWVTPEQLQFHILRRLSMMMDHWLTKKSTEEWKPSPPQLLKIQSN